MRVKKIIDCIDLFAGFELLEPHEKKEIYLLVIDTLCGYPKPTKKGFKTLENKKDLGAYLFVSNTRNACKLGNIGLYNSVQAYSIAMQNLSNALTLLQL